MNYIRPVVLAGMAAAGVLIAEGFSWGAQPVTVDLIRRAPPDITTAGDDPFGKLVKYGYALFTDTANEIGPTVTDPDKRFAGNNLACQSCHLQAGTQPYAMPLVGISGQFPRYRPREGAVDTLEDRIDGCMERSLNGRALPVDSHEMTAFSAFMEWLSTGVPRGAKLVGAGTLRIKEPERAADPDRGGRIYALVCAACHGPDGLGRRAETGAGYQFPPLWGSDSFNDGAGMSRLLTAAAFAMHNMPIGTTFDAPVLSDEEAYDVAAYFISRDRPRKSNLDRDFPILLEKPVDTPYGPYADGFGQEQHTFGPFAPIRARVEELAAASRTPNTGGPDNGTGAPAPAR